MILADTSVWIDNFRNGNEQLTALLYDSRTIIHPFVIGELALGNLHNRKEVLYDLKNLPMVPVATHAEVLFFIEEQGLAGKEVGYVDAHLLASVALFPRVRLWTLDTRLHEVAEVLGLGYEAN